MNGTQGILKYNDTKVKRFRKCFKKHTGQNKVYTRKWKKVKWKVLTIKWVKQSIELKRMKIEWKFKMTHWVESN